MSGYELFIIAIKKMINYSKVINITLKLWKICLRFRVPSHLLRNSTPFFIPLLTTNYLFNSPLLHLMRLAYVDPNFDNGTLSN